MQKWEYGFLTRDNVATDVRLNFKSKGYFEVKFNENIVAKGEYDTKNMSDKDCQELEARCLQVAFNKLGRLGWELCTDTLAVNYFSAIKDNSVGKDRFIFRRPLE